MRLGILRPVALAGVAVLAAGVVLTGCGKADTGGGSANYLTNVNIVFDDSALANLGDSGATLSGSYRPSPFWPERSFWPRASRERVFDAFAKW